MSPRIEKIVFNSILNFRRVTHFRLWLLETQVVLYVIKTNLTFFYVVFRYSAPYKLKYTLNPLLSQYMVHFTPIICHDLNFKFSTMALKIIKVKIKPLMCPNMMHLAPITKSGSKL